MLSILGLFEETKNDNIVENSRNKYIKNINIVPDFYCPEIGSKTHQDDIEKIKWYYDNKSLSSGFLTKSDESVKKIYKSFCKENNMNVDWKKIKKILKDVHSIVWSLKSKYKRPRPKEILLKEDDMYGDIIDTSSYSFPSGHTTTAYFLSEVLSYFFPSMKNDLSNLSALVGQSRIENCVHYPSDVLHGQFLGELLANAFIENKDSTHAFCHSNIKKKHVKNLQDKLYSIYQNNNSFIHDMTDYITSSTSYSNQKETNKCIKNFISGYNIKKCTSEPFLQDYLNALVLSNKLGYKKDIFDYISIEKLLTDDNSPILRHYSEHYLGNECSEPGNIISHLGKLKNISNPFSKFLVLKWINPFCSKNNILNSVDLIHNTDYDPNTCCDFINVFDNKLKSVQEKYKNINALFKYL